MKLKGLKTYFALAAVVGAALLQAPVTALAIGPGETGNGTPSKTGPGVTQETAAEETKPANPYAWEKVNGVYQMEDTTPINGVYARGIDVSHWQGDIDWAQVAADDVSFVMLGTRYDGQVDPKFHQNAQGAARNGIKLGAYIYSYATTPEMASQEADFILNVINGYNISYPVVFDVEATVMRTLSKDQLTEIVNTFCSKVERAGYQTAVYANEYWLYNLLDMSSIPYDVWVARYGVPYTYSNPYMWQATNTGSINGIKGNVDIDFQFKSAPHGSRVSGGGPGVSGPAQTTPPAEQGQSPAGPTPSVPQASAAGWVERDGEWFHYSGDGRMETGWILDNGKWYYLDFDGTMEKEWTMVNGKWYYLKSDGSMVVGWRQIGADWYYFQEDGQMAFGWQDLDGGRYYLDENGRMKKDETFVVDNVSYYADAEGRCQ